MYSHDRREHHYGTTVLVVLLSLITALSMWLAWRNARPLKCIQKVDTDNMYYCEIPIGE